MDPKTKTGLVALGIVGLLVLMVACLGGGAVAVAVLGPRLTAQGTGAAVSILPVPIEGKWVASGDASKFGWETLEFKPNGVVAISGNDKTLVGTYEARRGGVVIVKYGVMEHVAERQGNTMSLDRATFVKQ